MNRAIHGVSHAPSPTPRWDFLIIGAGIAGLSLAEALASQAKVRILVLEAARVGAGASTRNAGRLAHAGMMTPELAELARQSRVAWYEMQRRIRWSLHLQQLGEVTVYYREQEVERFEAIVQPALRAVGLKGRLIAPARIPRYVPGYDARDAIAAFYSQESFVLHHDAAIYGLMEVLLEAGVSVQENSAVTGFLQHGEEVTGVMLDDREVQAANVILCCGDAAIDLVKKLGWETPLKIERQQMIVTETIRNLNWPIVRWTGPISSGSCHQMARGEVVAACQDPNGDTRQDNGCTASFLTRTARQLFHHLPILRKTTIMRQWGGVTTKTTDHLPFAGPIPGRPGAWGLFGMNAFTLYPLIAQWLAAVLLGKQAHPILERCTFSSPRGMAIRPPLMNQA